MMRNRATCIRQKGKSEELPVSMKQSSLGGYIMLRLSVTLDDWLKIGDDINVIVVGLCGNHVKLMIDAPKDIPVVRNRAREKYLSVEAYKREQRAIAQKIRDERGGNYMVNEQIDIYQWIAEEERRTATYAVIGKGKLARDCYNAIFSGGTQQILAYINPQRVKNDCNIKADGLSALLDPNIDYIVAAVPDARSYRSIEDKLRSMGIPREKIFWVAKV